MEDLRWEVILVLAELAKSSKNMALFLIIMCASKAGARDGDIGGLV